MGLFTQIWFQVLNLKHDNLIPSLRQNSEARRNNKGYQIQWTFLFGDMFHQLCLLYHNNVMCNRTLKPILGFCE